MLRLIWWLRLCVVCCKFAVGLFGFWCCCDLCGLLFWCLAVELAFCCCLGLLWLALIAVLCWFGDSYCVLMVL